MEEFKFQRIRGTLFLVVGEEFFDLSDKQDISRTVPHLTTSAILHSIENGYAGQIGTLIGTLPEDAQKEILAPNEIKLALSRAGQAHRVKKIIVGWDKAALRTPGGHPYRWGWGSRIRLG